MTGRERFVGGGVGGCSVLYWLARLGWDDVVLVERAELTSGSTFHSAGLVGQLRGTLALTKMMMASVDLYRSLEDEVGLENGLARSELASARLVPGADGGDLAPGRLGEDLWSSARADFARRGAGALPAADDEWRAGRGVPADRINSYKRYAAGSWAPTTLAWGNDNRTCGFRLVGHGSSKRVETRIPGGDVNPYLAFAAMIAAGLYGIENELELPPGLEGNAYESDAERFPSSLREAMAALEDGTIAREAFGDQVVDHYLNYARTEQALFDKVVTDWERIRLFERG